MSSNSNSSVLHGIVVPLPTPFKDDGNICPATFRSHIEGCIKAGVHGFWVNGGTGYFTLLTEDERKKTAEIVVEYAAGRVPVWVHVGGMSTAESIRLARHCSKLDAAGISSVPPLVFGTSFEMMVSHLSKIQEAAAIPLTFYHVPGLTKVNLTTEQLLELFERVQNLVAIKYSDFDFHKMVEIREHRPDIQIMLGQQTLLLAGLSMGCADGTVGTLQNIAPEPLVNLYNRFNAGDSAGAKLLHRQIAMLSTVFKKFNYLPCAYGILNLLGFEYGTPRFPMDSLDSQKMSKVTTELCEVIKNRPFEEKRLITEADFQQLPQKGHDD